MIDLIGYVGSTLFAFCGAPAAFKCYKDGYTTMSKLFTWMWFLGEILTIIYVSMKHGLDIPLMWNYCMNIVFILVIFRYMYFPVVKKEIK